MTEADTFIAEMMGQDPIILVGFDKGDGTVLFVKRLLFHWTLLQNVIDNFDGYEDRWCYQTPDGAVAAVEEWQSRNWEGEPTGWHRHHKTGRRRVNGDPATEYIAH